MLNMVASILFSIHIDWPIVKHDILKEQDKNLSYIYSLCNLEEKTD